MMPTDMARDGTDALLADLTRPRRSAATRSTLLEMRLRAPIATTAALGLLAAVAVAATSAVTSLDAAKRTVSGKSKTIVVDNRGVAVYELGGESLAKLECFTRTCFATWPPVKVPSATTRVTAGPGVPGTTSVIHRVKGGFFQVMLDRHPLYYYSGDGGHKGPVKGQGIQSFGGTWHAVPASTPAPSP
jgi:predicted lipoprotein with Yx(FWY)xxD motif